MNRSLFIKAIACALILAVQGYPGARATGSDAAKERRWADQVVDGLLDGEALWLADPSGYEFFNVLTEADGGPGRAAVLIHGIGVHPNWPDVIYPLRAGLFEEEMTTLSVQMPILANDAQASEYLPLFAEVPGRLDAAIGWLRDAGYGDIVLIAHSMGASMTSYYLARNRPEDVSSVILIGMGPGVDGGQNIDNLARITVPVFDLYGEHDLDQVLESAAERAAAGARIGEGMYRQAVGAGADHFWQGEEALLLEKVGEWLQVD